MTDPRGRPASASLPPPPAPVLTLLETLRAAGHAAYLVGGCVRDALRGVAVADFDVATAASPDAVLACFPRAVPIGLRHGTVMVPTETGPIDVTRFRGADLEEDLAHRDFTVNAIAWDPLSDDLRDPCGGRADLAAGTLRAVGSADARFDEDPLRALRAARLVAVLGVEPDAALAPAMQRARARLAGAAGERVRHELEALLLGPRADAGLALLQQTGILEDWFPSAPPDTPAVVAALPFDLDLRLTACLRGREPQGPLARLRYGRRRVGPIARLLGLHPIDAQPASREAELRRLLRRAGERGSERLLALRAAELAAAEAADPGSGAAARTRLDALRAALARTRERGSVALRPSDLAVDGRTLMEALGIRPGPRIGALIRHLLECVVADPTCNTRERLLALGRAWQAQVSAPGPDA